MTNQRASVNSLLSKFMIAYLPSESGDDLELPKSFNSFVPKTLPRSVTVRSVSGKMWRMALRKVCGDEERYALVNGWKRITKDEDLNGGDRLAFEFDGSRSFNFCIYDGRETCKRTRTSSKEEESRSNDDVVVLDDDERRLLDDRDNAFFKTTLNPNKKSQLRIPTNIIKDYGLTFGESITVVDPQARKFGTLVRKIKIQGNKRVFVKGFGSVIRRNKVKLTDKLVFELKKSVNNNIVHTIKLYIISG